MPARAHDDLLDLIRPVRQVVDLRAVDWVTPATMVAVAAVAHEAHVRGERFAVRGPAGAEPAHYAARMRLGTVLSELGAEHDLPDVGERDQSASLVELRAVRSQRDAARIAKLVFTKLSTHDPQLADALYRSIGEIGGNVPEHSGTIGFMAAQTMRRRNDLLVAVADGGRGLLATLDHRGAGDHDAALRLAVRPSVSEFDGPTRGTGLPTTLRLITELSGSVYLASGTASVRHRPSGPRYLVCERGFPGTIVEARIPLRARPARTEA